MPWCFLAGLAAVSVGASRFVAIAADVLQHETPTDKAYAVGFNSVMLMKRDSAAQQAQHAIMGTYCSCAMLSWLQQI